MPTMEGTTLCVAVDSMQYQYDVAGNMVRAENNWAKVRRAYYPNGQLSHDTLITRRYETEAPGPCGGGDKHAKAEGPQGLDWLAHRYALRFEYDLAGRRTKLHHPDQLDPCTGACEQRYVYDAVTGVLDSLIHPSPTGGSLVTRFGYDDQLRLVTTYHPGNVSTTRTYDRDGRVLYRTGPETYDTLSYDAAGRMLSARAYHPAQSTWRTTTLGYAGLGALSWAEGMTNEVTYEDIKTDALGNRLWIRDPEMVDGIDRTKYNVIDAATGQLTATGLGSATCGPPGVPQPSCHPVWYVYEHNQAHDASGNVDAAWGKDTRDSLGSPQVMPEEIRSYYAADEKLMYYNRHFGWYAAAPGPEGVFDEYRYDALGRRVYLRSRRPGTCAYPCEAYVERTVWDGDQALYEIRSSGKTGVSSSYMDGEGSVAPGDDENLFGRVVYAHAQGIDQPVGILKRYGSTWGYVTPHANWKGDWTYGTFSDGSLCLTVGAACPYWPGFYLHAHGGETGSQPPSYTVWWGSLIRNRADGSGLQYLRNRYYDPTTGRFTQQDPIGLAGGLNLYGFANGDPINFSDPFGLQPCDPPGPCRVQFVAAGTAVGAATGGVIAAGCTLGSGGICSLGAPVIIGVSAGVGAAVGGFAGTVAEHAETVVLEASRLTNKVKEAITAILIALGGGKPDVAIPPPPPAVQEERPRKKDEDEPSKP